MIFERFHSCDTVGSTMDVAADLVSAGEAPGTVVMAEYQTGGRGRQGRSWFAPRGANVCLTAIGWPVPAADAWRVTLLAGVAAARGIAESTPVAPRLRFPNDLYLGEAKLGGILIETASCAIPECVLPLVGIGVNINVAADDLPEELRERATSILRIGGKIMPVGPVAGAIVRQLGALWDNLTPERFAELVLPEWRRLRDADAVRAFVIDGVERQCRVRDVTASGDIQLESADGGRFTIHAAQVIFGAY